MDIAQYELDAVFDGLQGAVDAALDAVAKKKIGTIEAALVIEQAVSNAKDRIENLLDRPAAGAK